MTADHDLIRLTVTCRDQKGILAAISRELSEAGANITASHQYSSDTDDSRFFLRIEARVSDFAGRAEKLHRGVGGVAEQFDMQWRLAPAEELKRVAIFVSRYDHCLLDLLWRLRTGHLKMNVVAVVSNHPDLREQVEAEGIPYHHIPVTRETKAAAEAQQIELLRGSIDLIIMARYMQILSGDFLRDIGAPVINIHHSFLPAFAGAEPYARAALRGVKLIGATAHYATEDLDEGPIIEQDVHRVNHTQSAHRLEEIGRDVERVVLARAVDWHLQDRVFVHGNRTVVF